ncbi:MAG: hypothetical protein KatS3mg011_0530 [Acidimicrobiia bacterium]|nr:MAG: hypothetical protein KatS3mg011_0530 [Acidimicrobiia bacterium]
MNVMIAAGLLAVAVVQPELPVFARLLGGSIAIVAALTVQTVSAWRTTTRSVLQHATHEQLQ